MHAPDVPLPDAGDAARLAEALRAARYTVDAVAELLGPVAGLALGRGDVVPGLRATRGGSPLETLVRLFLLDAPVPVPAAAEALAPLTLDAALAGGLVHADGADVLPLVDVRPHAADDRDLVVVSDLDRGAVGRPHLLRPDHVLGVGSASALLAEVTVRDPVGDALDVGTGCGVQALHLRAHARHVVATDTNPRALAFTRLSAVLSGIAPPELLEGDLLEPVAGRTFDLVVSNPPFVVGPGLRFSYRDAGLPGDEVSRRLVTTLPSVLAPGGTAQLLASWLHVRGQAWEERVERWVAATGCDAWVLQRAAVDPAQHVATWLQDAGEGGDADARDRADAWLADLEGQDVEALGFGVVVLRAPGGERGRAGGEPDVVVEELTGPLERPFGPHVAGHLARRAWLRSADDDGLRAAAFRRSDGLRLADVSDPGPEGWVRAERRLVQTGGASRTAAADDAVAALVAGCDGTRPLGVLLDVLEAVHDVEPAAALPVVRQLVGDGFLLPPG